MTPSSFIPGLKGVSIVVPRENIEEQTLRWFDEDLDGRKQDLIMSYATEGKCYVLLLLFLCDLACIDIEDLRVLLDWLVDRHGLNPEYSLLQSTIIMIAYRLIVSDERLAASEADFLIELATPDLSFKILQHVWNSNIKLKLDLSGEIAHVLKPVGTIWCDCEGPVCIHGWSFRMVCVVLTRKAGVRVGASGFDMDEFMKGGLQEDEDQFEEAFSQLQPDATTVKKSSDKVKKWANTVNPREIEAAARERMERLDPDGSKGMAETLPLAPPPPPPMPESLNHSKPPKKRVFKLESVKEEEPVRRATETPVQTRERLLKAKADQPIDIKALDYEDPSIQSSLFYSNPQAKLDTGLAQLFDMMNAIERNNRERVDALVGEFQEERRILKDNISELTVRASQVPEPLATPPTSPKQSKTDLYAESLLPQDSSSVVSRYQKRFMPEGTVLTTLGARNAADIQDNRTQLTVDTGLVEGFKRTNEIVKREVSSIKKLKPINGLPRPFTSARLNFLANLHTGLQRCYKRAPEQPLSCLLKCMKQTPELPVDDLLHQVLIATIDRHKGEYASNAFNLPYIEVGMVLTEESIVKCFDLLFDEYKILWFNELKNISVPDFHDRYKRNASEQLKNLSRSKTMDETSNFSAKTKPRRKGTSILGF